MSQTERFDDTHFLSLGGSTREIKPGDVIGGYTLKSLLGRGGMGYVFLAEHNIVKRDYALKIIRPDKLDDFSWQRFEIEGRVIAKLDHPNIVKIYNMGIDQGSCPFYVMDLLSGEPLSEYINRGDGLTFEQCLDIFRQVAEGLAYAHKKGIVHRDIKPANIIMLADSNNRQEDGFQAKIVDFGLAKVINAGGGHSQLQAITAKGQIFGSPYYMSPEQCLGQTVDHRSDIYSLGCALFESIAGEPPFIGANAVETLLMHTESAMPKLADRFSEGPASAVDLLIAKMTAKEPYNRYQSMAEVAVALERLQERGPLLSLTAGQRDNSARGEGESSSKVQSSLLSRADSKWLLLGSLLVLFSIVAAAAYVYRENGYGKKHVSAVSNGATDSPDAVAILNFGPIKSRLVSTTGYREFRFPDTRIGAITDMSNSQSQPAIGSVFVDRKNPMAFAVDEHAVPITFKYPQVIEQIGKNEFCSLYLKAKGSMAKVDGTDGHGPAIDFNGLARSERIAYSQKQLIEILKIVQSWKQLSVLTIDGFAESDQVFQLIENLPNLRAFTLKRADYSMKDLAQYQFLKRLTLFAIQDPVDSVIDPLLIRLAESSNLISLELDNVEFSAQAVTQLKRCPRLSQLTINRSEISDEVIAVISQLKGLVAFHLEGKKLTDNQIASLAELKKLHVTLEADDYTGTNELGKSEILKAYRAKFPTIAFK